MDTENLALAVSVAVSAFIVVIAFWLAFRDVLTEYYLRYADIYRRTFVLQLQYPPNHALVLGGYIGAVLLIFGLMLIIGPLLAPFVLIAAYFIPGIVYTYQKTVRRKKVDDVLANVLQQLAANTKNVGSISLALQEVAQTAPVPMDYELELISRQEQELKSFTKALENARNRLKSQWFDIVTAVLQTAEEKGGKTSAALGNLSRVFVQLKAMQTRIDTATSQGRTSMKVMLVMPFVVVAIVYMVDPGLVAMAVANTAGKVMLGLAVFFYILALGISIWLSKVVI
jgi:tight adherence protein B